MTSVLAKTFFLGILFTSFSFSLFAHHILAGNFSYNCVNNQEIELELQVLIEEDVGGADPDEAPYIAIFYKAKDSTTYEEYSNFDIFLSSNNNIDANASIVIPKRKFVQTSYLNSFSNFDKDGDYLFVYQRCCKNSGLTNLISSDSIGSSLALEVSFFNNVVFCNDSPQLEENALIWVEPGEDFNFKLPIEEADGDSLSYTFGPLFLGGGVGLGSGCNSPAPQKHCPLPFDTPDYFPSYSQANPFGNDGIVNLEATSGIISGNLGGQGRYSFGVEVQEFRNGSLLGVFNFEMQIEARTTVPCNYDLILTTQEQVDELGNSACTPIKGDLTIIGSEISDLSPLLSIDSIYGSLIIKETTGLLNLSGFASLVYIGGKFEIDEILNLSSLGGLSKLDYIGESLIINKVSKLANLDGFSSLKHLGKNLEIYNADNLISIEGFSNLDRIGESLIIRNVRELVNINGFSSLSYLGKDLNVKDADNLISIEGFSNLDRIGGSLIFDAVSKIVNLDGLSFLKYIGQDLDISYTSLTSIEGLSNLDHIGGGINFVGNESLLSMDVLPKMKQLDFVKIKEGGWTDLNFLIETEIVKGEFLISSSSNSLELLPEMKLRRVGGHFTLEMSNLVNLSVFKNLNYVGDDFLVSGGADTHLIGFNNLKHIGGSFFIWGGSITDIIGFNNLETLRNISITVSPLENIIGFQKLSMVNDISILGNESLRNCDVFCNLLSNGEVTGEIRININAEDGNCKWPGICGISFIGGEFFFDENENGIKEDDEINLNILNTTITTQPAPLKTDFRVANTNYVFTVSPGQYEIVPNQQLVWKVTNAPLLVDVFSNSRMINKDVGLTANYINRDAETYLVNEGEGRCGTIEDMFLTVNNTGNVIFDGKVQLEVDPNFVFQSANPVPTSITGNTLTWEVVDLLPTQNEQIVISLKMPTADKLGEPLSFVSRLFDTNQKLISDFDLNTIITCSYDPNDKQTHPLRPGIENYTPFGKDLVYTIRFENIGNGEAIDVRVEDALPSNLDLNSFQLLQTSHPLTNLRLDVENSTVHFSFDGINLDPGIDLNGDPIQDAANKGFLQFKITPIAGLPEYTIIQNKAEIYFDYNEPIITNIAINTLVSEIPQDNSSPYVTEDNPLGIRLQPNPVSTNLYIGAKETIENAQIELYNLQGQKVGTDEMNLTYFSQSIFLEDLAAGVYVIKITNPLTENYSILQFVKMN